MTGTAFGVGQAAWIILWFSLFFIEIWLMVTVFMDLFRSRDLSGWAKALWVVFILVFPLVGILGYLIVRGDKLREHELEDLRQSELALRRYIRTVAGGPRTSPADEIAALADLERGGVITREEFEELKRSIIGDSVSVGAH